MAALRFPIKKLLPIGAQTQLEPKPPARIMLWLYFFFRIDMSLHFKNINRKIAQAIAEVKCCQNELLFYASLSSLYIFSYMLVLVTGLSM